MRATRILGSLAVALAGAAFVGPTTGLAATPVLRVQVGEWNIVPSRGSVAPGAVRLTVENFGRLPHKLEVIATTTWGARLPIRAGRAVGRVAGPPVVVGPGQTRSVRVTLMPGFYVLLDNDRGRYALGTEVPFLVNG